MSLTPPQKSVLSLSMSLQHRPFILKAKYLFEYRRFGSSEKYYMWVGRPIVPLSLSPHYVL